MAPRARGGGERKERERELKGRVREKEEGLAIGQRVYCLHFTLMEGASVYFSLISNAARFSLALSTKGSHRALSLNLDSNSTTLTI